MKKILAMILAMIALFTTTAFAEIDLSDMTYYQLLILRAQVEQEIQKKAPTPSATPAPTRKPLKQGEEGYDVLQMKLRLYELGYFTTNNLSEIYNGTTAERVTLFQKVNGLPQTGVADSATIELLFSSDAKETTQYKVTPQPFAEYQKFDFKTYSRHPENYKGQKFKLTGKVLQVLGDRKDGYEIRLATKGNYDDVVYVFVVNDPGFSILKDDKMNIYAVAFETITYKSVAGASITLPAFVADVVELK